MSRRILSLLAVSLLAWACASAPSLRPPGPSGPARAPVGPGQPASGLLGQKLSAARSTDAARLLSERALPFAAPPPVEPDQAPGMDRIRKSSMAPSPDEEKALRARGFSISSSKGFPTFTYGYATLYADHLPLYVSADSLLHVVHKGYDKALLQLERSLLGGEMQGFLSSVRARLKAPPAWISRENKADLDVFLAVGLGLLSGQVEAPVAGGDAAQIARLTGMAREANGTAKVELFGSARDVDFSQMKPRGHYTRGNLKNYFQAMMWFGRTDLRLTEVAPSGEQTLNRRQLEAALALAELAGDEARKSFNRIDRVVGLFVGEHDSMTLNDIDRWKRELGPAGAIASMSDAQLMQKLSSSGAGAPRVASQMLEGGTNEVHTLPRIFQLFGQRYTADSHVLSNVSYDRAGKGSIKRMMPGSLDVAFAALANDQAASLLAPELKKYPYAPDLASTRVLLDEHGDAYWEGSLYTLWLSAIRGLSPSKQELQDPKKAGLPAVATTEAWGRRLLNTQLASWAELRHDTLLYAKQSYSAMVACEFPDAYVDPYPAFYQGLVRYAEVGLKLVSDLKAELPQDAPAAADLDLLIGHYKLLSTVAANLRGMAERQRARQPFSAEQMAFINDAVLLKSEHAGCTTITKAMGWYPRLLLDDPLEFDPTIADVHTQPTDETGAQVGRVLHVGTAGPRRMIVVADTCKGPRAYVGLVSSYAEVTTAQFARLDDEQWAGQVGEKPAAPPPWMADLVSP